MMKVIRAAKSQIHLLSNLMQLYLHDLSPYTKDNVNKNGQYDLGGYFYLYWEEADRYPYICIIDGVIAGFALVRCIGDNEYQMADFFVLRRYRGTGAASKFAQAVFDQHAGTWNVAEMESNIPAQKFWRKTIEGYRVSGYKEEWSKAQPCGPKQIFRTPKAQQGAAPDADERRR